MCPFRQRPSVLIVLLASALIAVPAAARPGGGGKVKFKPFLLPDTAVTDTERDFLFCLQNEGKDGSLDGTDGDELTLAIPLGAGGSDLELDGFSIGCTTDATDWACGVDPVSVGDTEVIVRFIPQGDDVEVPEDSTTCFVITGVAVNSETGLATCEVDQDIEKRRADKIKDDTLPVFKSSFGVINHDDLGGVESDQHHVKTTLFSELTDVATDAQVPDDITVNRAITAGDADTVGGVAAADLEESGEIDADIAAHAADPHAHHVRYTDAEAAAANDARFAAMEARIAELEALLKHFSLVDVAPALNDGLGNPEEVVQITGANLRVVNGLGLTETSNGLGNLQAGYNELRGSGDDRSGSHVIVTGARNNYTSHAGIVAGTDNVVGAPFATVTGGRNNQAIGSHSSVGGGGNPLVAQGLIASGDYSWVAGGSGSEASGFASSAVGGGESQASGDFSLIAGGRFNAATGGFSVVVGGEQGVAAGNGSSVVGGRSNQANGLRSTAVGGFANKAGQTGGSDGELATATGGEGNLALGVKSTTGGGHRNSATGAASWAAGGALNEASGPSASASGGGDNTASGGLASVNGGRFNSATAFAATANGGQSNGALGDFSTVGGGQGRAAPGDSDWRAGTLTEDN